MGEKNMMKTDNTLKKEQLYKRGDLIEVDLGPVIPERCVQGGVRPCVIISNDIGNYHAPCVTVLPLTSHERKLPTHCSIARHLKHSGVLCEQAVTIDKKQIRAHLGHVSSYEIRKIERALRIALAL